MRVRIVGQFCDSVLLGLACDSAFIANYRLVKDRRGTSYILFSKTQIRVFGIANPQEGGLADTSKPMSAMKRLA
ncbi:hypothetical protein VCR12J2_70090 [Vibrio coralliirubri]|nr:hypothetical protein VCR12J2_70090 [Vibrio coralliirubri]